jgi:hypothetical protein
MTPDRINEILKAQYGQELDGTPFFRVVWSTAQVEIRKGNFNDFSTGQEKNVFLRNKTETREVKKYPFNKDRWVLERWFSALLLQGSKEELPFANRGSYEPLFVFEDGDGKPAEINEDFVKFLVQMSLSPISLAERQALDDEKYNIVKQDVKFEKDIIDAMKQSGSSFEGKLSSAAGEGIVVPSLPSDFVTLGNMCCKEIELPKPTEQGEELCQKTEAL